MTADASTGPHRYRLDLGYRGTDFHGWARQPRLRTVQGELEAALEQVTGAPVPTVVAGRTDAGVHARRQVVHLDLAPEAAARLVGRSDRSPAAALLTKLAGVLRARGARDIVVHAAVPVAEGFDARFAATSRSYTYRLADTVSFVDPLKAEYTAVHKRALRVSLMSEAAAELLGLHDFLPFCKPREGATTIRTLQELTVVRDADDVVEFHLQADAFCHHMVRALVGGLIKVGEGSWDPTYPAELLARADFLSRAETDSLAAAGAFAEAGALSESVAGWTPGTDARKGFPMFVAPAEGLVLDRIDYPAPEDWEARAERTRNRR